ncbi:MAG: ABC transporter transmembrane domain-containing protein [Alphaproteobacteria bacterium]
MSQRHKLSVPNGWSRIDVLTASFGINLLSLALPIVILQVYDRILPNAALDSFGIMVIGLCCVVLVEAALRVGRSYVMIWIGARFEHTAAVAAFDRILKADIGRFEREEAGTYVARLQGMDALREFYSGQAALVLVDLPFVAIYIGVIWFIAGWLVVIPVALLVCFAVLSLTIGARLRTAVKRRSQTDERRHNFIIETLSGVHTVKSMAMEPLMIRRHERLQAQSADAVYELSRLNSLSQGLGGAFSQIAMVAIVSIGSLSVIASTLTIGALAATILLTGRALQPVLRAMGLWTQFQGIRLARQRIDEIYALPLEDTTASEPNGPSGSRSPTLIGAMTLDAVSFRYRDDGPAILDNVSLVIRSGEAIGITGDNGTGKSTIVNLMSGICRPSQGRVLIDDRDMTTMDPVALRAQIGHMPQSGALFRGTLLDNLTMFREGDVVERAIDLSQALGLDEVITSMPRGLDTRLGETTVDTLPDGVKQRIIMVRALVDQPQIILFDNANAALDQQSDQRLGILLQRYRGSRTMVIASHRPSLLRMCDRCYRVIDGQLHQIDIPRAALPQAEAASSTSVAVRTQA